MTSKLAILAVATTIGVVGIGGVGAASALSGSDSSSDSLVTRLVEKFNLDEDEVQAVFEEEQAARESERQAEMSDRLQDAVDNGDITAEQKTLIEEKIAELQDEREAAREELDTWAEDNGIDSEYLMGHGHSGDDRLQDAVDDGDITAEQKTLIENKLDELKTEREAQRDELKSWAEEHDIDTKYLMGFGGGRGHGFGGRH